ncbi:hypothetical protein [Brevibacterium aurantiacum]|uniref:hypothetical protein n=1 Tax=Brevibacterium aurantiacum TaxID=273384 RepID=UPI003F8E5AEF
MADPTLEDLQTQITALRDLITTEYQPPSGIEFSYPVVNQPMNDEMWQYVTLGLGDGVFDEGGQPYWVEGRENAGNTLRITVSTTTGTAQAILRGFYHRLTEDKTFVVPGVMTKTVFHFCLTYNPVGSGGTAGPISLQMYAGTPPTTQGRFHIILWKLTREPNQLLTKADLVRVRPKITPMITVNGEADRPEPSTVLWGSRVLCTDNNAEYRATGSSGDTGGPTTWTPVTDPDWVEYGDTPTYKWVGHGYRRAIWRRGKTRKLRGRITPVDGIEFSPTSDAGYLLFSLNEGDRPVQECRFMTAGVRGSTGRNSCSVTIYKNGEVRAWPDRSMSWMGLDGIEFDVE